MKTLLFGNPNTDCWRLSCKGASQREGIVEIDGQLQVGFFQAVTPMCVPPASLEAFAMELEQLDRTLSGSATLESENRQSKISWTLRALPLGHIESSGHYAVKGNELAFSFRTDQTQLAQLLRWLRAALATYDHSPRA